MNEVVIFLKETGNVYGFKTLKKKFKLKNNALARYLNHPYVQKALPVEVGSGKSSLNIWKYSEEPRNSRNSRK
tara:strand:- start:1942 stop:2160 length:219 start_codon:yes stop_codon:yes gene_type:complete